MNDKSVDKLLNALDNTQKVVPSKDFLDRVQSQALSFAELKARYGKKALIILISLIAAVLVFNIILYKNATNTSAIEPIEDSEFDMTPVKTYEHE